MIRRRVISFVLLLAVLSANFSRLYVYAAFGLNQKFISTNLCENRSKPWLHCNGHCYLMKKIKQAEEKEKSEERQTQKSLFQESDFVVHGDLKFTTSLLQVIVTPYRSASPTLNPGVIFRPPQIG
jgi:hypothetical protein